MMSMRKLFWMLTLASTVLGGIYFAYIVVTAVNATNLTAGALVSLGIVVIPFIFTSCLEGIRHSDVSEVRIVGGERAGPAANRGIGDAGRA